MTYLLYKLTIYTNETINIKNPEYKEKQKWYEKKIPETIVVDEKYLYFIEYRIDEDRYYYAHIKPVMDNLTGICTFEEKYIMTKNDHEGSIGIIKGINDRTKILHPDWKIKEENFIEYGIDKYRFQQIDTLHSFK